MWEERKKVQIVTFAIESLRVWISIDKKKLSIQKFFELLIRASL